MGMVVSKIFTNKLFAASILQQVYQAEKIEEKVDSK